MAGRCVHCTKVGQILRIQSTFKEIEAAPKSYIAWVLVEWAFDHAIVTLPVEFKLKCLPKEVTLYLMTLMIFLTIFLDRKQFTPSKNFSHLCELPDYIVRILNKCITSSYILSGYPCGFLAIFFRPKITQTLWKSFTLLLCKKNFQSPKCWKQSVLSCTWRLDQTLTVFVWP